MKRHYQKENFRQLKRKNRIRRIVKRRVKSFSSQRSKRGITNLEKKITFRIFHVQGCLSSYLKHITTKNNL